MNVVNLVGRLTRDPELRETKDGKSVGGFTIAVDGMKDKNGEKTASFFNVVVWEGLADSVGEYCHKGDLVAVTGRLNQRSYDDKDGVRRNAVEIIASGVDFLTPKKAEDEADEDNAVDLDDEDEDEDEQPAVKPIKKPVQATKPVGKGKTPTPPQTPAKPLKKGKNKPVDDEEDEDLPF